MGHKNKNYQKTLHQQVYDKLTSMQAFGESKTTAKNDGTTSNKIFSFLHMLLIIVVVRIL